MFEDENWVCEDGHPATKMRYETAEISLAKGYVPGTWARVTLDGVVVFGPVRNLGDAMRYYRRKYQEFTEKQENA